MKTAHALVITTLAAGAIMGAAPARAADNAPCSTSAPSTTAKLVSGTLSVNDFANPVKTVRSGATLDYDTSYRALTKVTLSWLGNTAVARTGTFINLACYGLSVKQRAVNPSFYIRSGALTVTAAGRTPLGVTTIAALLGPVPEDVGKNLTYWAGEASSATAWPTTSVKVTGKTRRVNVTPYAGPRPGSCRVVTSARLVYNPNTGGTASYVLAR